MADPATLAAGLSALKSLTGGPAAPSSARGGESVFDSSGFVVNTGGRGVPSSTMWTLVLLAGAGLLGVILWRKLR